jgi:two-component system, sensor histidine kinase
VCFGLNSLLVLVGRGVPERLARRLEEARDLQWELSETEARNRSLLDDQDELIIRRDDLGHVTFINASFARMLAVEPDGVLGRPYALPVLASERATGPPEPGHRRFAELIATTGGERWIEWEEHRVTALSGEGLEWQCVGRDVTVRRAAEAALAKARDEALAANRAKSRFLAAMSHEIRTPMNGILGMVALLGDTALSAEQRTYLEAVDVSARTLVTLVDEILDFSKIEAGKLELNPATFDPRALVTGAVALLGTRARDKGLTLTLDIADGLPDRLDGDATRVRQILLNLLSNAIKFTDHGSIRVAVRAETETDAVALVLAVTDTGIGLSAEDKGVLFREFVQTETAARREQGGTGLGLAISRRLAEAMHGDIVVDSTLGSGSTFTATLRLAPASEADTAPEPPATRGGQRPARLTSPDTSRPRVLLAEDNDINALLARRVIERTGGEVVSARNGLEAVAVMEQARRGDIAPIDLILMDILMPELDGFEATRRIRALYPDPAKGACPPILALTAIAFAEDRDRCLAAGMEGYLAKPFDKADLEAILQRWLARTPAAHAPMPAA